MIEDGLGFLLVGLEAAMDHIQIGVIQAILTKRTTLQSFDHFVHIRARQMEYRTNIQHGFKHLCLAGISRDSVQNQDIAFGVKTAVGSRGLYVFFPQVNGGFIGYELSGTGVLNEHTSQRIIDPEVAKRITASEVKEARDIPEDLALGPFARSWSSEKEYGLEGHRFGGLGGGPA